MRRVIVVLLSLLLFASCEHWVKPVYHEPEVEQVYALSSQVLQDTFSFSSPIDLTIIDSLLIVCDSATSQRSAAHIFNKNTGAYIQSFCKEGKEPGKYSCISSMHNNHDGRSVTLFDFCEGKVIVYDVGRVLNGADSSFTECALNNSMIGTFQAMTIGGELWFAQCNWSMRFGKWLPLEGTRYSYDLYPNIVENDRLAPSIMAELGRIRPRPDGTKMVVSTAIGGIMEIFDLFPDSLVSKEVRYFYEPKFGLDPYQFKPWAIPSRETIFGFQDLCATNAHIYGLIWGVGYDDRIVAPPEIIQFDWAGNPLEKYTTSDFINIFAVDEDGRIYGIAKNEEQKYTLTKYTVDYTRPQ